MSAVLRSPDTISVEDYLDGELLSEVNLSGDENKDRVEKYLASQRIASMEEYAIVSCDTFSSIGVTVSVDELYAILRGV